MVWQCCDVAVGYFEEILSDLKKNGELIKPIECSNVLIQCDLLAAVSVNVCEAAEAPKKQAGK